MAASAMGWTSSTEMSRFYIFFKLGGQLENVMEAIFSILLGTSAWPPFFSFASGAPFKMHVHHIESHKIPTWI